MMYIHPMHRSVLTSVLRWSRTVASMLVLACALSAAQHLPAPQQADSILILKKDHLLELLANAKVIRAYRVALGSGGLAPKEREGDARTPEGHYLIDSRNAS